MCIDEYNILISILVFSHSKKKRESWHNKVNAGMNISTLSGPMPGVVFSQGQEWTEQRRFTLKTLRDFGFGKASKYPRLIFSKGPHIVRAVNLDPNPGGKNTKITTEKMCGNCLKCNFIKNLKTN